MFFLSQKKGTSWYKHFLQKKMDFIIQSLESPCIISTKHSFGATWNFAINFLLFAMLQIGLCLAPRVGLTTLETTNRPSLRLHSPDQSCEGTFPSCRLPSPRVVSTPQNGPSACLQPRPGQHPMGGGGGGGHRGDTTPSLPHKPPP